MIGILLISHGSLGQSLIECSAHVLGTRPPKLEQISVCAADDPKVVSARVAEMVDDLDEGQGVLILTDIFGATPSNIACRILQPGRVEGIAGVNLPMLLRALTYRQETLSTLVSKALSGGCAGVVHITQDFCSVRTTG